MFRIDETIRSVYSQGPGAQIPLKTNINRGNLIIDEDQETIVWSFVSKVVKSEPGEPIQEGNLIILTTATTVSDKYNIDMTLNYSNYVDLQTPEQIQFVGSNQILIRNEGSTANKVNISISEI